MLIFPQRIECSVVGREKEAKTIMKEKPQCVSGWEGAGGLYKHFPSLLTAFCPLPHSQLPRNLLSGFSLELLGISTTSQRACKPENSHIALLTNLVVHDTGTYFSCVLVGVWLKTREMAAAQCQAGEGCALWGWLRLQGLNCCFILIKIHDRHTYTLSPK